VAILNLHHILVTGCAIFETADDNFKIILTFSYYFIKICRKFKALRPLEFIRSICVNLPNFVASSEAVAEIWRFFDFKMAAICRLEILAAGTILIWHPSRKQPWSKRVADLHRRLS